MSWTQPPDLKGFFFDCLTNPDISGVAGPRLFAPAPAAPGHPAPLHRLTNPVLRQAQDECNGGAGNPFRGRGKRAYMVNKSGVSLTKPCTAARRLSVVLTGAFLLWFRRQEIGARDWRRRRISEKEAAARFGGTDQVAGYRLVDRSVTDRMINPMSGSMNRLGLVGVVLRFEWVSDAWAAGLAALHRGNDEGWRWGRPHSGEMTIGFI